MFKYIQQYLSYRKKVKLEKTLYNAAHDAWIEKSMKDGTLWKNAHYPKGHPAHISTVD